MGTSLLFNKCPCTPKMRSPFKCLSKVIVVVKTAQALWGLLFQRKRNPFQFKLVPSSNSSERVAQQNFRQWGKAKDFGHFGATPGELNHDLQSSRCAQLPKMLHSTPMEFSTPSQRPLKNIYLFVFNQTSSPWPWRPWRPWRRKVEQDRFTD